MVMQVTAQTPAGSSYDSVVLKLFVCTGVTETGGAVKTGQLAFVTPPEFTLTPAGNGSLVLAAISNVASGTETWTPAANNATSNTGGPTLHSAGWWYGHYTGTTATGTPITLGCTETTNNFFVYGGIELLASGSPAIDASTPAPVTGGVTFATSPQFSPPGSAVLVAVVLCNGGSAQTFSVVDSSGLGLTWTQRSVQSVAFDGSAAIFTATLPSVIPPSPITQSASGQASPGPLTVTYPSNLTAGSKMLAYVQASDPVAANYPGVTVADSHGNSFTLLAQALSQDFTGHNTRLTVWGLDTPTADAGTAQAITATLTGSGSQYATMLIQEVPNLLAGNAPAIAVAAPTDGVPVNITGDAGGPGLTTGSPPYSSSAAGEFLVSVYCDDGAFKTAGGCTWTAPITWNYDAASTNSSAGGDLAVGYKKSTGGAETGSWTVTVPTMTGTDWAVIMVAFQPKTAQPSPSVTTTALPLARASSAYTATLQGSGGTAPYAWSISSGSLPVWATLNSVTGVISGTAPAGAGSTSFTVKITDGAAATATQAMTITVLTIAHTATANQDNYVTASQSPLITGNVPGVNASTPYTNPNAFNPQVGQSQTLVTYTATNTLFTETVSNSSGSVTAYPSLGFYYSQAVPITDYPYLVSGWDALMDWSTLEYGSGIIASMAYDLWFVADQSSEVMIHPYLQSRGSGPCVTGPVIFGGYTVTTGAGPVYIPPQYWRLSFSAGASTSYWIKVNASGVPEWPGLSSGTVDVLAMLKYLVNPLGIWAAGKLPSFIGFGFGYEVCSTQGLAKNFSVNNFFWYGPAPSTLPLTAFPQDLDETGVFTETSAPQGPPLGSGYIRQN